LIEHSNKLKQMKSKPDLQEEEESTDIGDVEEAKEEI
jgi:hypothetical protein